MQELTYKLESFEGPLDLLLSLIQKNKLDIKDIPIAFICDRYIEYINEARAMDMDLASEFIVMASELMLIKSKMLLPKPELEEEDPRHDLAELLLRFQRAKAAAVLLAKRYEQYSGRYEKDTDEISPDKTFVADQEAASLALAMRRIISYNENRDDGKRTFTPMISAPIVPVEVKIVGIIQHLKTKKRDTLENILRDSVSLPDMIAIFLGILELMKLKEIIIDDDDSEKSVWDADTRFIINPDPKKDDKNDKDNKNDKKEDVPV